VNVEALIKKKEKEYVLWGSEPSKYEICLAVTRVGTRPSATKGIGNSLLIKREKLERSQGSLRTTRSGVA